MHLGSAAKSQEVEFLNCGDEVMLSLLEEILCVMIVCILLAILLYFDRNCRICYCLFRSSLVGNRDDKDILILVHLTQLWCLDPRLTARHGGGHVPRRIVMSQSLNLPDEANIWDVAEVPTIVATQRGARRSFQKFLASKGVEVVEFDILDPRDVMEYLYDRGYLSVLWECGGTLAASAISSGVIHKV